MMVEASCTDCGKPIEVDEDLLRERAHKSRLCAGCAGSRNGRGLDPDLLLPMSGLGNYRMSVEMQWAISPRDLVYVAYGDMEEDFARRSMFAMRDQLQLIAGNGHNKSPIGHYHLKLEDVNGGHDRLRRCDGPPLKGDRPPSIARQYHDALNRIAVLVLCLEDGIQLVTDSVPAIDFSEVFRTLAIGRRQGWPVDSRFDSQVAIVEDDEVSMSEEEAKRRMGIR